MDIALNKKSNTNGCLTIKLVADDYQMAVEKKIKEYSHKMDIKGFRKGKVPSGIIKKMYGKPILIEEVNQLAHQSTEKYLRESKLNIIGAPLSNQEKIAALDWDKQTEFEFEFEIGFIPDFSYSLSSDITIKEYRIEVSHEMVQDTLSDITQRFGKNTTPQTSKLKDYLQGTILPNDGGQEEGHKTGLDTTKVKPDVQHIFVDKKPKEKININIDTLFDYNEEKMRFIGATKEKNEQKTGQYTFTIEKINRNIPAKLDTTLYDAVFGKGVVNSKDAFLDKIKQTIEQNYERETERLLSHEIEQHFIKNTDVEIPKDFLKTWIKTKNNQQSVENNSDKGFENYVKHLQWEIIQNKIAKDNKITVDEKEVIERAKTLIAEQYGGASIVMQLGEQLDDIAKKYLSDQNGKNYIALHKQLQNEHILKIIRERITIKEKIVTLDAFKKIAEKQIESQAV